MSGLPGQPSTPTCDQCRQPLDRASLLCDLTVCCDCARRVLRASRKGTRPVVVARTDDEWTTLVAAIRQVAGEHGGEVDWTFVRPMIRGRIEPKHVGTLVRRARREGLLIEDRFDRSEDVLGKNAGRMEPKYRLGAVA